MRLMPPIVLVLVLSLPQSAFADKPTDPIKTFSSAKAADSASVISRWAEHRK